MLSEVPSVIATTLRMSCRTFLQRPHRRATQHQSHNETCQSSKRLSLRDRSGTLPRVSVLCIRILRRKLAGTRWHAAFRLNSLQRLTEHSGAGFVMHLAKSFAADSRSAGLIEALVLRRVSQLPTWLATCVC
jgi:hypothetical protein